MRILYDRHIHQNRTNISCDDYIECMTMNDRWIVDIIINIANDVLCIPVVDVLFFDALNTAVSGLVICSKLSIPS